MLPYSLGTHSSGATFAFAQREHGCFVSRSHAPCCLTQRTQRCFLTVRGVADALPGLSVAVFFKALLLGALFSFAIEDVRALSKGTRVGAFVSMEGRGRGMGVFRMTGGLTDVGVAVKIGESTFWAGRSGEVFFEVAREGEPALDVVSVDELSSCTKVCGEVPLDGCGEGLDLICDATGMGADCVAIAKLVVGVGGGALVTFGELVNPKVQCDCH